MKIAVYAICCNEAKNVDAFLESIVDADHVTIVDTGSTDDTPELLRTKSIMLGRHYWPDVAKISIKPFRFDVARNTALALVPDDIDVCIKLDLDETMDAGWRKGIEDAWTPNTTRLSYQFNYTPTYRYHASWIHSRHGYVWQYPIHEQLRKIGADNVSFAPGVSTTHHKDLSKPRDNYLNLLQMAVDEDPCARNLYYLTREHYYHKNWHYAIASAVQYIGLNGEFHEERQDAMSMMADSLLQLGKYRQCADMYFKAMGECPWMREPIVAFAKAAMDNGEFSLALGLIEMALALTEPSKSIFVKAEAWGRWPFDMAAACAFKLGAKDKAMTFVKQACAA